MQGQNGKVSRLKKRRKKRIISFLAAAVILASAGYFYTSYRQKSQTVSVPGDMQRTAVVERQNITSELTSSGSLSPRDTYTITALVEGEVVLADFEEGDQVEKGQVLYQIDGSSVESEIQSAESTLNRARQTYQSALDDYHEVQAELSGNTYKATKNGFIKELYIEPGDKVSGNTKIADVYSDQNMKIRLPFLSGEAQMITVGSQGTLTLTDTGEQLPGAVIAVSDMEEVLAGGTLVKYVTMQVENPGGLTGELAATALVGEFVCAQEGYFEAEIDTIMSSSLDSSVEVDALLVTKGSHIAKGTPLFTITAKSAEKILKTYTDAIDKANESIESAESKLDTTKESYGNYTITAPISGQVITKSAKEGDNISKSSSSSGGMAVIYDLSALTFEMSIDELDIQKVKPGQKVIITADAFEGEMFTGTVTNVSLQSNAANGVTNYPVTVMIEEKGSLMPGMNVTGTIILEEVQDVLAIPVDCLMRGNRVYVKDESSTEAQGQVPAGFRAVEVETGLISNDYVEIVSGLEAGMEIYVDSSSRDTPMMSGGAIMVMPAGGGGQPGGGGQGGGPRGGGR